MLVSLRPSSEALLRARAPGARDQRGCRSSPFHRGGSASKKDHLTTSFSFSSSPISLHEGGLVVLLLAEPPR